MKKKLLLLILILSSAVHAMDVSTKDDFYAGLNCAGDSFNCGNQTDNIIDPTGTFNVTIASADDGQTRAICAVFINNSIANAKTCIFRNTYSVNSCDSFSTVSLGNHSEYYVCPNSNLSTCGWNGQNSIPLLGLFNPANVFQINTSIVQTNEIIFISYICNGTPNSSVENPARYFRVVYTKGTQCDGNLIKSVVYDSTGQANLGTNETTCSSGTFCDPGLLRNFSISGNISGNFCTPGCDDNIKNGGETDVDYGGAICGNCTPNGKAADTYYQFAKEVQTGKGGRLTGATPFNQTYCSQGEDVGNVFIFDLLATLLTSGITIVFLIFIFGLILTFIAVTITRFIKRKKEGDR